VSSIEIGSSRGPGKTHGPSTSGTNPSNGAQRAISGVIVTVSSAKTKGPVTIEVKQISEVSLDCIFMILVWEDLQIHPYIRRQPKIGSFFYNKRWGCAIHVNPP
jgi:hypothetical protein